MIFLNHSVKVGFGISWVELFGEGTVDGCVGVEPFIKPANL